MTNITKKFIDKARLVHGDRYDYSITEYTNSHRKVRIVCHAHGEFEQRATSHLQGFGCRECGNISRGSSKSYSFEKFELLATSAHNGKYTYDADSYSNFSDRVRIICPIHGEFWHTPNNHISKMIGCPLCSSKVSSGQLSLQERYKALKPISNYKLPNGLEVDLLFEDLGIAVEFNGLYWHSDVHPRMHKRYHLEKTLYCRSNNIHLIHVFEHEWKHKQNHILEIINSHLGLNDTVYARQTTIRPISRMQAERFCLENHLQGFVNASIHLGGFDVSGKLLYYMSFAKSRFNKNVDWELIRYCSVNGVNVVGGASKILKYFIREFSPNTIISYCNNSKFNGNMYSKLGFNKQSEGVPSYFYWRNLDVIASRYRAQKHRLASLLGESNFDASLSEYDNMINNGYNRVWDCGNSVWVMDCS